MYHTIIPMVDEALVQLNQSSQEFNVFENEVAQIDANNEIHINGKLIKEEEKYQILLEKKRKEEETADAWTNLKSVTHM